MARSKKPNVAMSEENLVREIQIRQGQLQESLNNYQNSKKKPYPIKIVDTNQQYDFINPAHYVKDDGKQTWERMVDKWGEEETALWCEMTAFKYQDRIGKKPGEDVEREQNKIKWYEDKAVELRELAKKKKFW